MTAFFNTGKNRAAQRRLSAQDRYNRRNSGYNHFGNGAGTVLVPTRTVRLPKKTQQMIDAETIGFQAYSIKYGDIMIVGDIQYMLPNYQDDVVPNDHNMITNGVFGGILCDKVALIYSVKMKKYLYLALNDNYTAAILFKADNMKDLPNIENIDIENLHPNVEMIGNVNRTLVSVYYNSEILDLTNNPLLTYRITEILKK